MICNNNLTVKLQLNRDLLEVTVHSIDLVHAELPLHPLPGYVASAEILNKDTALEFESIDSSWQHVEPAELSKSPLNGDGCSISHLSYKPDKAIRLGHPPPGLDADRSLNLSLVEEFTSQEKLNGWLIVGVHKLVPLVLGETHSVLLVVFLVNIELSFHLLDLICQLCLLLRLPHQPLLMSLLLQTLQSE